MYDNPDARAFFHSAYQQNAPGCSAEVHGAKTTVGTVGPDCLVEVANQNHSTAGLVGRDGKPLEDVTYLVGAVHVHIPAQVTLERVQDHQIGVSGLDRLSNSFIQQRERTLCFINAEDALKVSACTFKPGLDGITQAILRSLIEDVDGRARFHAGQSLTLAAHGCDPQSESGLAFAGIPLDDGQLAVWYIGIPQPLHLLSFYVGHSDQMKIVFVWGHRSPPFSFSPHKSGSSIH